MDTDEIEQLLVCNTCISEKFLSEMIRGHGQRGQCHYCSQTAVSFSIGEIADLVARAFEQHYCRTTTEPNSFEWALMRDPEENYSWSRSGESVVDAFSMALECDEAVAQDVQAVLDERYGGHDPSDDVDESEFAFESHYERIHPGAEHWHYNWQHLEHTLRSEARFFSRAVAAQLAEIFADLDRLQTKAGNPVLVTAGPGCDISSFFRARCFQSDEKLKSAMMFPDRELGPPAALHATAGRMNARGVGVFYGADTPDTAIAEVRPPVGAKVLVGKFELIKPMLLLDLTALAGVAVEGSIFDTDYANRIGRATFLESLCTRIVRPVMPDDEAFDYLATQAIADYLASENVVPMDGILFSSVQRDGKSKNVVIFRKSSHVEEIKVEKDCHIDAETTWHDEDGIRPNYSVRIELPAEAAIEENDYNFLNSRQDFWISHHDVGKDLREPMLRLLLDSLAVHHIQAVDYVRTDFSVSRRSFHARAGVKF